MPSKVKFYNESGGLLSLDEILAVDEKSHAIAGISTANFEIHRGNHFYIEGFTTLADAGTLYAKLVVPDLAERIYFRWVIDASGILETNFYEDASGGMTGGSEPTIFNSDRNSGNKSDVVVTSGVTVATDKGTKVSSKKVGGTGFKTFFGGASERDDELILKRNTIYFREFISGSAANIISYRASWYEI